jgi:hypothetical protein
MKSFVGCLVMATSACGGSTSDQSLEVADGVVQAERYFPIVGASWGYEVTENGNVGTKVQAVLALEEVGGPKAGIMAYKVQSTKPSGRITISWQEDTGT